MQKKHCCQYKQQSMEGMSLHFSLQHSTLGSQSSLAAVRHHASMPCGQWRGQEQRKPDWREQQAVKLPAQAGTPPRQVCALRLPIAHRHTAHPAVCRCTSLSQRASMVTTAVPVMQICSLRS